MTAIPAAEQAALRRTASGGSLLRVALVCDFLEEQWPSMDLFGDMLGRCLKNDHAGEVAVEQMRPPLRARFSALPLPGRASVLWNADRLVNRFRDYPRWLRRRASGFDLFHIVDHSYSQLALELPAERTVVSCHDVDTFRCLLEPGQEPRPRWFRAMTQRVLDGLLRAAHVLCLSESTKSQLLRHGLFSGDKLSVVYPGVDTIFTAPVDDSSGVEARRIVGDDPGQTYLLHVGSTIPRKRIEVLLRVFAAVLKEFPHVRLVRVGGRFTAEQSRLANDLGVGGSIVHAPFLSTAALAAVYQGAALLLQTSDAEGFGLPVIEAMACGCPVLASDIPPLREAAGPDASYCAVGDIEAWSATLVSLLRERASHAESWMARQTASRQHAAQFSWSETAKQTIAIYRRVWSAL